MSIETEKWVYSEEEHVLRNADTGKPVPLYADGRLKAVQVLPEALALLKEMIGADPYASVGVMRSRIAVLLEKAGVHP